MGLGNFTIQHLNFTYKFKFYEDYIYYGKLDNIIITLKIITIIYFLILRVKKITLLVRK